MHSPLRKPLAAAPNSRKVFRHLATVEHHLWRRGSLFLHDVSLPALHRILEQLDGVANAPLASGLAALRESLVDTIAARERLHRQSELLQPRSSFFVDHKMEVREATVSDFDQDEIRSLWEMLRGSFQFDPAGEYAIEIDPRSCPPGTVRLLAELGFNRASFGVQDFDPAVQRAVNRIQPYERTRDVFNAARSCGFKSLNIDLIYGLPKQSVSSFADTVAKVLQLRPDRIALYSYAHLPARFKPQRRILDADLPSPAEKLGILARAIELFNRAGYVYIGMDPFALPGDELAAAQRRAYDGHVDRWDRDEQMKAEQEAAEKRALAAMEAAKDAGAPPPEADAGK